jgi:hypothetical protein
VAIYRLARDHYIDNTQMPACAYLIDVFTLHAASAMAANTVLRSLVAAVLPLAGLDMYRTLGYGMWEVLCLLNSPCSIANFDRMG